MALIKNKWLWTAALGLVLSTGLLLVAVGYLGLVVYTGLVTGTPLVDVLVDVAVPAVVGIGLLTAIFAVSGVGFLWVFVRNASLPRSQRVASLVGRLEREYSPVGAVGVADLLAPPEPSADERAERALADLKQRYVEGELSEAEFERKVDRLVANDSVDEVRAARERRSVVDEESHGR
jgi:hypothetical protein